MWRKVSQRIDYEVLFNFSTLLTIIKTRARSLRQHILFELDSDSNLVKMQALGFSAQNWGGGGDVQYE